MLHLLNERGKSPFLPKLLLSSLILLWAIIEVAVVDAQALEGCEEHCGNLSIPYPFGTREGCYMNRSFLITCNRTYDPPLAFLPTGNINVIDIWPSGELRVYAQVACKRLLQPKWREYILLWTWNPFGKVTHLLHPKQIHGHWLWHIRYDTGF